MLVGAAERMLYALVAQRAVEPGSKLAATRWVAEAVATEDCADFSDDSAYAAMDFLLDALPEIAARIFASVAHLLNLDVDVVFDTTSTYWEVDVANELADLAPEPEPDDEVDKAVEGGARRFGKSKDHRDDLPQVVIAMAVTRDGIPVRCWTFPGDTGDQRIIRTVKDHLGAWNVHRLVRVAQTRTGQTWRNLRHELDRMHLVALATADGRVAQRSTTTSGQKTILAALDLPEPPKYLDITPSTETATSD